MILMLGTEWLSSLTWPGAIAIVAISISLAFVLGMWIKGMFGGFDTIYIQADKEDKDE
jgi:hypothetical protein